MVETIVEFNGSEMGSIKFKPLRLGQLLRIESIPPVLIMPT